MNEIEAKGYLRPASSLPDQAEVDVFISYSEGDEIYVGEIGAALDELNRCMGLSITYCSDVNNMHTSFTCSGLCAKIAHLIEVCKVYIHIGNHHANRDNYAFRKAHYAVDVSDRKRSEEQPSKALLTLLDGEPQSVLPSPLMFLLSNINHRQKSQGVHPVLIKDITRRLGYENSVRPTDEYAVFVSYSHVDQKDVRNLSKRLDEYIIEYFMYENDISGGENYMEEISSAINKCKVFLFAGSAASYASKYTLKELHYAAHTKSLDDIYVCDIDKSKTPMPHALTLMLNGKSPILISEVIRAIRSSLKSTPMSYVYGSIYDFGKAKGLVYYDSGRGPGSLGRAIGVEEKELPWSLASNLYDSVDFSGYSECDDDLDGYDKRRAFRRMPVYHKAYPAAGYCAELEDKWYLPKLMELTTFCDYFDAINDILIANGYEPFKLDRMYWSASEKTEEVDIAKDPRYAFGCVFKKTQSGRVYYEVKQCLKTEKGLVRPFLFFGLV